MIDDNSNPLQQTSTKGLIHVTSDRKKNGRTNHVDRNVRVTNKKAAQAHQDYSLPAADSNCFAPDVTTARQVLQERLNQTNLDTLKSSLDYPSGLNSTNTSFTSNTSEFQNAGVNDQLNQDQTDHTLTSNNSKFSAAANLNQTFKAPLAALVNGGNHGSSLTGKSRRRKKALKASPTEKQLHTADNSSKLSDSHVQNNSFFVEQGLQIDKSVPHSTSCLDKQTHSESFAQQSNFSKKSDSLYQTASTNKVLSNFDGLNLAATNPLSSNVSALDIGSFSYDYQEDTFCVDSLNASYAALSELSSSTEVGNTLATNYLGGNSENRENYGLKRTGATDKTTANTGYDRTRKNTGADKFGVNTLSNANGNSNEMSARLYETADAGSVTKLSATTLANISSDMQCELPNMSRATGNISSTPQDYGDNCNHTSSLDEEGYIEPFAELESTNNAIYLPQKCSTIHKMTDDEVKEEEAKTLAYERAVHRAALRTEMDENTLRNNPMLMSLLTNSDAVRKIMPSGHHPSIHPKKDLIENVKHGTSIFPFACYVWVPQNYSYRVALHWHPEVELVRFNRGLFKISIDMQDTVIEDNAFMLLPGNIMHTFTMPPNCEESALVFDPRMLMLQNYDEVQSEIFEVLTTGNMPLPPVITPEHPCFSKIDNLYSYCIEHGATTNASHRLMIKAKLLEILATYHEYGLISRKEVHTNIKRSKQDKLKELLNYIDSHYAGPITIKDASNRLGVTDQYFCRFFKRVTGMSFTEYLNDLRLRRAAKEIELTNRAISDIAYEHGFENVGYFFKSFKNKFSMTPLKYRKKHLASQQNR